MKVETPIDPRMQPFIALRRLMPLVDHDREEQAERHELRKLDLREQVKK